MKEANLKIRVAEAKDAAGIARIHIKSWQETYRGLMPNSYLDNLESVEGERRASFWRKNLSAPETRRCTWVAETNDEIIAFVSVAGVRTKSLF